MTAELTAALPAFEGREIRVLEKDGAPWFPLTDLAAAWGTALSAPYHIVDRNPEIFEGLCAASKDLDVTATTGKCVNEQGLYLLMGRISADRLKNKDARAAIIRFQRWVPELIQRYRKGDLRPAGGIEAELQEAREYAAMSQGDPRRFQAAVFRKHGMPDFAAALLEGAPPIIHGEAGWFNPTQLGERCGLRAHEVNSYLYNRGYQYPQGPLWRLQPKGEPFGREYWFTAQSGHQEIRIAWREAILLESGLIKKGSP